MPNPTPSEIRDARAKLGLTQQQAGELIGATRRTWQDWEAGRRNMPRVKFETVKNKIQEKSMRTAYITGKIFALLDANKPLNTVENSQADIYPAKFFALVLKKRKLTTQQDKILGDMIEEIDSFPEGPMSTEQKSQFWIGWHHFKKEYQQ